jgi:hypothetical protein
MQVLPPKRWHCSVATFCAFASESAFAQPLGPQAFLASIANAAQVLRKFATTLRGGLGGNIIDRIAVGPAAAGRERAGRMGISNRCKDGQRGETGREKSGTHEQNSPQP